MLRTCTRRFASEARSFLKGQHIGQGTKRIGSCRRPSTAPIQTLSVPMPLASGTKRAATRLAAELHQRSNVRAERQSLTCSMAKARETVSATAPKSPWQLLRKVLTRWRAIVQRLFSFLQHIKARRSAHGQSARGDRRLREPDPRTRRCNANPRTCAVERIYIHSCPRLRFWVRSRFNLVLPFLPEVTNWRLR